MKTIGDGYTVYKVVDLNDLKKMKDKLNEELDILKARHAKGLDVSPMVDFIDRINRKYENDIQHGQRTLSPHITAMGDRINECEKELPIFLNNIKKQFKDDPKKAQDKIEDAKYNNKKTVESIRANLKECEELMKAYEQTLSYFNKIKSECRKYQTGKNEEKKSVDKKDDKKSKLGFFKKKLTKESADDFKLEVYESWNNGILTDSEKNFMINYINESVEEE